MNKFILGAVAVSILAFSNPALAMDNKMSEEISAPEVIMPVKAEKLEVSKPEVVLLESNMTAEYKEDTGCQQYKNKLKANMPKKAKKPVTSEKYHVVDGHKEKPVEKVKIVEKDPTPSLVIGYKTWENKPDPIPPMDSHHQDLKEYHKEHHKNKHMKYDKYAMREKDERTAGFLPVRPEDRKYIKRSKYQGSHLDDRTAGAMPVYVSKKHKN